jgi:hypothetical protein
MVVEHHPFDVLEEETNTVNSDKPAKFNAAEALNKLFNNVKESQRPTLLEGDKNLETGEGLHTMLYKLKRTSKKDLALLRFRTYRYLVVAESESAVFAENKLIDPSVADMSKTEKRMLAALAEGLSERLDIPAIPYEQIKAMSDVAKKAKKKKKPVAKRVEAKKERTI